MAGVQLSSRLRMAARVCYHQLSGTSPIPLCSNAALQHVVAHSQEKASPCTPTQQLRPVFDVSAFVTTSSSTIVGKAASSRSPAVLTSHQEISSTADVQQYRAQPAAEAASGRPEKHLLLPSASPLHQQSLQERPGCSPESNACIPAQPSRAQASAAQLAVVQPAAPATRDSTQSACLQPAVQEVPCPVGLAAPAAALPYQDATDSPVQPASSAECAQQAGNDLFALASLATHLLHSPPRTRDRILHYGLASTSAHLMGPGPSDAMPDLAGGGPSHNLPQATDQGSALHGKQEATDAAAVATPAQAVIRRKVHFSPVEVTGVAPAPQWALAHQQALERRAPYGPRGLSPGCPPLRAKMRTPSPTRTPAARPISSTPSPLRRWAGQASAKATHVGIAQLPSSACCLPAAAAAQPGTLQRQAGVPEQPGQQPFAQDSSISAAGDCPMPPPVAPAYATPPAVAPSALPDIPRRLVYERLREARSPDTIAWRVLNTPQQVFREAYLSAKLGRAWEDGQAWAETDMNGIQLSRELCSLKKIQYVNAASHLVRSQGKRLAKHFCNLLEKEWRQLKALRMQACNHQVTFSAQLRGLCQLPQSSNALLLHQPGLSLSPSLSRLLA